MTTQALAAQYVREQIEIIRKHGGKPRVSAERREQVVDAVRRTFESMIESAHAERASKRTQPIT